MLDQGAEILVFGPVLGVWRCLAERAADVLRDLHEGEAVRFCQLGSKRFAWYTYVLIPPPMEKPAMTISRGDLPFDAMPATALVSASSVAARMS